MDIELKEKSSFVQELEFVKPLTSIINYRIEQKELIEKALEISNGDLLNALKYIALCLFHENNNEEIELVLVFQIPRMEHIVMLIPIVECMPKDGLGYYINWGDGTITHNEKTHIYNNNCEEVNEYVVRIFGFDICGLGGGIFELGNCVGDICKQYTRFLTKVLTFGNLGHIFTNLDHAFDSCNNLIQIPTNIPRSVRHTNYMFSDCYNFNLPVSMWDMSNIYGMNGMFRNCGMFNQPLNKWIVCSVTSMNNMFTNCRNFNQPLDEWNTCSVTDMSKMFFGCTLFNQPLVGWNTRSVTDMSYMFMECKSFNQPLVNVGNAWDTRSVTNMKGMFLECVNFNQSLDSLNTFSVKKTNLMFYNCVKFNQPLASWDTSYNEDMDSMFSGCQSFNQPIESWNVSNVMNMNSMFHDCLNFNQPIGNWKLNKNVSVRSMFYKCLSFDQPLCNWWINHEHCLYMFEYCKISIENMPQINKPKIFSQTPTLGGYITDKSLLERLIKKAKEINKN